LHETIPGPNPPNDANDFLLLLAAHIGLSPPLDALLPGLLVGFVEAGQELGSEGGRHGDQGVGVLQGLLQPGSLATRGIVLVQIFFGKIFVTILEGLFVVIQGVGPFRRFGHPFLMAVLLQPVDGLADGKLVGGLTRVGGVEQGLG
jgi:hypothetical protein